MTPHSSTLFLVSLQKTMLPANTLGHVCHSAASSPVPAEAVFRASALLSLFLSFGVFAHLQPTPRMAAFYKAQFKFPFCKPLCSIQCDWGLQNQMKSHLNPKSTPTRNMDQPTHPLLFCYHTSRAHECICNHSLLHYAVLT